MPVALVQACAALAVHARSEQVSIDDKLLSPARQQPRNDSEYVSARWKFVDDERPERICAYTQCNEQNSGEVRRRSLTTTASGAAAAEELRSLSDSGWGASPS